MLLQIVWKEGCKRGEGNDAGQQNKHDEASHIAEL
jgi:hypothetical protein